MAKYRKKPVVIEAVRWIGNNFYAIKAFADSKIVGGDSTGMLLIDTLEGQMKAAIGDYIIRGIKGEFYPCKPDIFEATYESAE